MKRLREFTRFCIEGKQPCTRRIPDVRRSNRPLPGAPSALYFSTPQTVFIDDLPKLPVDDEALVGRWRDYLRGRTSGFSGNLFISLPVVQMGDAVAVVNVNVRDQTPWYRALSPSWLNRAARLAAPWTVTAWHAFMLAWMYEGANDAQRVLCQPRKVAAFVPMVDNSAGSAKRLMQGGKSS